MRPKLEPLSEQAIVITGASSGIGLATARMTAAWVARVVLAARSEDAQRELADEITRDGGKAVEAFGGFDTWVNDAGAGVYGAMDTVSIEDMRRSFESNFWSQIYGSREALRHLRTRGDAIINYRASTARRSRR